MHKINYAARSKIDTNSGYNFQRLVGKRFLELNYDEHGQIRWNGKMYYDVILTWDDYILSYKALSKSEIPVELNDFINAELNEWDILPNHACMMMILFFKGAEKEISFNTFDGIEWHDNIK